MHLLKAIWKYANLSLSKYLLKIMTGRFGEEEGQSMGDTNGCVQGKGEMTSERKQGIQIINRFRDLGLFLWVIWEETGEFLRKELHTVAYNANSGDSVVKKQEDKLQVVPLPLLLLPHCHWHRTSKTFVTSYVTRALGASLVLIFGLWHHPWHWTPKTLSILAW